MLLLVRCVVGMGAVIFLTIGACFAQGLEREQGPYQPIIAKPSIESVATEEDKDASTNARADSSKSPVRLKKIEEKMQQLDAIKQNKTVENQAIGHFQQGESLYREGKKKEANAEWMQAIELSKDPQWMKRTVSDAKRKAEKEAREKKLIAKEEKKQRAIEEKQKKKLERLKRKEDKRRQKLITFNQKPAKFFPLRTKPSAKMMDLSKPPKTGVSMQ